jgi:hypothetical protein
MKDRLKVHSYVYESYPVGIGHPRASKEKVAIALLFFLGALAMALSSC